MNPLFSFLLPTRANTGMLRNFLDSLHATCSDSSRVEVILCQDSDDIETAAFSFNRLTYKRVIAAPGLTMGALNNLCFSVATGEFVMLVNDDIMVRTPEWDRKIIALLDAEPDRHLLIHVNDEIFGQKLCTFPMLSRKTVELIGLCNEGYRRYAIDDHICEIFHILRFLGHDRIRYLDDVLFEHLNYGLKVGMAGEKTYVPRTPPEHDWALFHSLLGERKQAALTLALDIDGHKRNLARYTVQLDLVDLDKAYRKMPPSGFDRGQRAWEPSRE
jgi:hypothetical protein